MPSSFQKAPNLQTLAFHEVILENNVQDKVFGCLLLEAVLACFMKQLKEVRFKCFRSEEYEFRAVLCLKNCIWATHVALARMEMLKLKSFIVELELYVQPHYRKHQVIINAPNLR